MAKTRKTTAEAPPKKAVRSRARKRKVDRPPTKAAVGDDGKRPAAPTKAAVAARGKRDPAPPKKAVRPAAPPKKAGQASAKKSDRPPTKKAVTAAKKRGGRPAYKPSDADRTVVETLVGLGVAQVDVARAVNCSVPTLEKHYRHELTRATEIVKGKLVTNLMRLTTGDGNTALNATKFMLQCRFGWSQYKPEAPLPATKDPPKGKKEQQQDAADSIPEGSSRWAEMMNRERPDNGETSH